MTIKELVNEKIELAQKRIKNGAWSLSKNGTYIRMVYEKGITNEVITISELSEKELTLFMIFRI